MLHLKDKTVLTHKPTGNRIEFAAGTLIEAYDAENDGRLVMACAGRLVWMWPEEVKRWTERVERVGIN